MARPTRLNGFSGGRLLKLRWEACMAAPPDGAIAGIVDLFGIPRDWLFRFDDESILKKAPVPRVEDDALKDIPLRKLQRWTGPALQLLGKSANALALKVELPTRRIQEILAAIGPPVSRSNSFAKGWEPISTPPPS